jgi:hypothetical protein
VHSEVLNPRRAPRVAHRCLVEVRDRFATWLAQSEDLGPRGCQLVTPRLAAPGRDLAITIRCTAIGRDLRATARVVWSRTVQPHRLGLEFLPGRLEAGWFEQLLAAEPEAAARLRRLPDRLPRAARVYLGEPPIWLTDFSAEEVALLRRVGDGASVAALANDLGSAFERVRGSLFALLSRRLLVLLPGEAVPPARWRRTLESAERILQAEGTVIPGPTTPGPAGASGRTAAAQALFDESVGHLTTGRIELAVARLREARRLAPGDRMIAGALERLEPWSEPPPAR